MGISNFFKRKSSDWLVDLSTFLTLDGKYYKKLHNIPVKFEDGHISKIDHVYVSVYGIFIVTSKHKKGYIEGEKDAKEWCISKKKQHRSFRNPILKNRACITALNNLLLPCKLYTINEESYKSIVAFYGECSFSKDLPTDEITTSLISSIKSYTTVLFDDIQIEVISNSIEKEVMLNGYLTV